MNANNPATGEDKKLSILRETINDAFNSGEPEPFHIEEFLQEIRDEDTPKQGGLPR